MKKIWDFLNDEIVLESQESTDLRIKAQHKASYKEDSEKKHRVLRFIEANPNFGLRNLVKRFDLDWDLIKEYENGMAKVKFLAGNLQIFDLHVPTNEWFR